MSKEIKEILENVKKCCEVMKNQSFVVYQKTDILKLLDYIEQKENIIKEAREYIESNYFYTSQGMKKANETIFGVKLLQILDKENSNG